MGSSNDVPTITVAESIPLLLLTPAALIVVAGYLLDRIGLPIDPLASLLALSTLLCLVVTVRRQHGFRLCLDFSGLAGFAVATGLTLLYLGKVSGHMLMPASGATDLVDHLTLIDYIRRHDRLVHNVVVAKPYLEYMATYPAGSHILGAVTAARLHISDFRALQPITGGCVVLEVGILYNVILRLLPAALRRPGFAVAGCGLLLLPWGRFHQYWQGDYLAQSFLGHEFFYSQIVAQMFVLAALWALAAWNEQPSQFLIIFFALCSAAVLLCWPGLGTVPVVALALLLLWRRDLPWLWRVRTLLVGASPAVLVGIFYLLFYFSSDHVYLTHEGDMPTLYNTQTNWLFAALLLIGLFTCVRSSRSWPVLALFSTAVVQYAVMLVLAQHGVLARYVAHKMLYLLIFAGAAIGARGLAELWPVPARGWHLLARGDWSVLGVAIPALIILPGIQRLPWPPPRPYSVNLYRSGVWAHEHVPPQCVDYVTQIWQAEYWLHVAVLGNRRDTPRTNAILAEYPAPPEARWHPAHLQPYVIVDDATVVPPDITAGAQLLFLDGRAAVFQRPGNIPCTEAPIVLP